MVFHRNLNNSSNSFEKANEIRDLLFESNDKLDALDEHDFDLSLARVSVLSLQARPFRVRLTKLMLPAFSFANVLLTSVSLFSCSTSILVESRYICWVVKKAC